ncbi:MAG: hypothetical protein ACFE95_02925 [Candidatus Hodarchaeota archaeon]
MRLRSLRAAQTKNDNPPKLEIPSKPEIKRLWVLISTSVVKLPASDLVVW